MSEAERAPLSEPRALVAIDRATDAFVRAFPYLAWRYGEPGRHDLRDDNALLLATATTHPDDLEQEVRWVAEQMTRRGQPRWMLELDLELLARAVPTMLDARGVDVAETLRSAAALLTSERHATMAEGKFQRAAAGFAAQLGFGPSRLWRGFGQILCAAVIDERRGHASAVERVREWAVDPHRFGPGWISAVEAALARARQL